MFRTVATQMMCRGCLRQIVAQSRDLNRRAAPMAMVTASVPIFHFVRTKYVVSGIQGNRNSKQNARAKKLIDSDEDDESSDFLSDLAKNEQKLNDR